MKISTYSQKYLGDCGILQLMADLGEGVSNSDVIMLGGGNPAHIPEVQELFRAHGPHPRQRTGLRNAHRQL